MKQVYYVFNPDTGEITRYDNYTAAAAACSGDCKILSEGLKHASVLQQAQAIIYGDREQTYGHPAKNLQAIADFWNAYLENRQDEVLAPADVCNMMVLMKTARLLNTPGHKDSLVDICGYTALQERIKEN